MLIQVSEVVVIFQHFYLHTAANRDGHSDNPALRDPALIKSMGYKQIVYGPCAVYQVQ